MEKKEVYPVLKAHDHESRNSFIYFDEWVELPDGSCAEISLRFDRGDSFDEMQELIDILKHKRMKIVIDTK